MTIFTGERTWLVTLACVSGAYFLISLISPWSSEGFLQQGSALFPRVIGLVLILLTVVALLRTFTPRWERPDHAAIRFEHALTDEPGSDTSESRADRMEGAVGPEPEETVSAGLPEGPALVVASTASLSAFVLLFLYVGAATAVALFLTAALGLLGGLRWRWALLWGLVGSAVVYSVFVLWLGVRLPAPILM